MLLICPIRKQGATINMNNFDSFLKEITQAAQSLKDERVTARENSTESASNLGETFTTTQLTSGPVGEKRKYLMDLISNASSDHKHRLYIARTGCQWRNLPHDFPIWSTVYSCFHRWSWNGVLDQLYTALHQEVRLVHGKKERPTLGIVDSQSVKVPAKGGTPVCCKGALTVAKR